jgi:hypothetical protein
LNLTTFPPITSTAGTPIFTSGNVERPLAIAAAPTALNASLQLNGFSATQSVATQTRAMWRCRIYCSTIKVSLIRGASQ